ncbi:MAG: Trk system potassium transporter TrkA [Prevotella sp.]|jgi:trk system potassium uptake protein TrkA|nr:Trk system potassium transporter TrkA [Prevotella sp.]MCH4183026.1 Trk system potassium transporter TrkA [Prevotella sp.]MCH4212689.1 Trk system potassium transporter TrkA [Prevotella sp.]MCH4242019.1 Trk system potassium transporter TrkA [Prevotella sp.]MCI1740872.1 Trk system potassium transporter TrkA [Prevotella sp.]
MRIIISGAYAIGTYLAKLLARNKEDITLIDENADRLAEIGSSYDLLTLEANPGSINTLKEAGVQDADLYIAVTKDEALNLNTCILAKALGAKKTVGEIKNSEYVEPESQEFLKKLGIDSVIFPEILAAQDINNGLKMSWVRQRWDVHDGALVLLGIKLRDSCKILNQPLKNISGPDDPYHIVAIKRGEQTIIPGGNDTLKTYDLAYFMTTKDYIPYIRKIVGKENYEDVKNVMFMGGGETAVKALNTLPEYMNAKVIENNKERCKKLNELVDDKIMIIHGDGRDVSLLQEEGVANTQAFVALTPNTETNILACLTAKKMGVRKTVAMVENIDYISMAESLDIGTIINKKVIAACHIYQMMLDADVMDVQFLMNANTDVVEFIPKEGSKVTKKPVKNLGLPYGATIGGLIRDREGMLVSGNTQIKAGDSVIVFCFNISLKKIEKFFI